MFKKKKTEVFVFGKDSKDLRILKVIFLTCKTATLHSFSSLAVENSTFSLVLDAGFGNAKECIQMYTVDLIRNHAHTFNRCLPL